MKNKKKKERNPKKKEERRKVNWKRSLGWGIGGAALGGLQGAASDLRSDARYYNYNYHHRY